MKRSVSVFAVQHAFKPVNTRSVSNVCPVCRGISISNIVYETIITVSFGIGVGIFDDFSQFLGVSYIFRNNQYGYFYAITFSVRARSVNDNFFISVNPLVKTVERKSVYIFTQIELPDFNRIYAA